jgi:hypothetical protein
VFSLAQEKIVVCLAIVSRSFGVFYAILVRSNQRILSPDEQVNTCRIEQISAFFGGDRKL